MPKRSFHILELTAPFQGVARRQGDLRRNLGLKFVNKAPEIATMNVHADDDPAPSQFARDLRGPLSNLDAGNALEGNLRPPRCRQQQITNCLRVISEALGNANCSRKSPLAFVDIRHPLTPQSDFDEVIHIGDVNAMAGDCGPVNVDRQVLLTADLLDPHVTCARN